MQNGTSLGESVGKLPADCVSARLKMRPARADRKQHSGRKVGVEVLSVVSGGGREDICCCSEVPA